MKSSIILLSLLSSLNVAVAADGPAQDLLQCTGAAVPSQNVDQVELTLRETTHASTAESKLYFYGGFVVTRDDGYFPNHSIVINARETARAVTANRRPSLLGEDPEFVSIEVNKRTLAGVLKYKKYQGYGAFGKPRIQFTTNLHCVAAR